MNRTDEHGVLMITGMMAVGFLLAADCSWNMKILFLFSAAVGFLFGAWYGGEVMKRLERQKAEEAELDDVDDQWDIVDPEDAQDGLERRKRE